MADFTPSAPEGQEIPISGHGVTIPDAQDSVPGHTMVTPNGQRPHASHGLLISMEDVTRQPVEWLWEPYLAVGKLCMLDGDPGVGKTMLTLQLAATLSRGQPFPDQHGKPTLQTGTPARTLFIAMEDDLADTVKPRLEAAKADCTLVTVLNEVAHRGHIHPVTLDDLPVIAQSIEDVNPRLVVIDSIQSVIGSKVDIHRANQVNEKLGMLADLARHYRCAIVCVRHPSKPGQSVAKLIHRGMGSVAFIGKARLGLFVEEHPTDQTKVLLVQAKSNAGTPARTQLFSKKDGQFHWAGVTRLTKTDLAGSGHGPEATDTLAAYLWLEDRLKDHLAWPSADLHLEAEAADVSKKVLYSASKRLGIVKKQTRDGWTWRLPPLPPLTALTTPPTDSTESTDLTGPTGESDPVTRDQHRSDPDTPHRPDHPDRSDHPVEPVVYGENPALPVYRCYHCKRPFAWDALTNDVCADCRGAKTP